MGVEHWNRNYKLASLARSKLAIFQEAVCELPAREPKEFLEIPVGGQPAQVTEEAPAVGGELRSPSDIFLLGRSPR